MLNKDDFKFIKNEIYPIIVKNFPNSKSFISIINTVVTIYIQDSTNKNDISKLNDMCKEYFVNNDNSLCKIYVFLIGINLENHTDYTLLKNFLDGLDKYQEKIND